MKFLRFFTPKSMTSQMVAVLAISLAVLLFSFTVQKYLDYDNAIFESAKSDWTIKRIRMKYSPLAKFSFYDSQNVTRAVSHCHNGHSITREPFEFKATNHQTDQLSELVASKLNIPIQKVKSGIVDFKPTDFGYGTCEPGHLPSPMVGIVVSTQMENGLWLNTEVHSHEWHFKFPIRWLTRSTIVVLIIGIFGILFIKRLSRPLKKLTDATSDFAQGLEYSEVPEKGPSDLKQLIVSFNNMQKQVVDIVEKRTTLLAAISHDVRTPLTALRIKAELIEDKALRKDLIRSIDKMEKITASALEYLRGRSYSEPLRVVELNTLIESECHEFEEIGHKVIFNGTDSYQFKCRPDALSRAIRNLVENAVTHADEVTVTLNVKADNIEITVTDNGPGIPEQDIGLVLEPFKRLSEARESKKGGFGLGLAVVQAVVEGHKGTFSLANIKPGLKATIALPVQ